MIVVIGFFLTTFIVGGGLALIRIEQEPYGIDGGTRI